MNDEYPIKEIDTNKIDMEMLDDTQIQLLVMRSTIELARRKKLSVFEIAKDMTVSKRLHKFLRPKEKYIITEKK